MGTNTGEIQPITRDVWVQPELNRKDVQVIAPVAKAEGGTAKKVADDKSEPRDAAPSWVNPDTKPEQTAVRVQTFLNEALNVELNFQVDSHTGQLVVLVLDRASGEVIRQIPQDGLMNLQEKLEELRGILFDGKA
ncbi:MAG: flagellar protein FlaG [Syntrophobacteraceae bacterium]